jgi:FixJ family two-component response regulator
MTEHAAPLTLAVIDDDEHIQRAVGRLLRSHGHAVLVFGSAEAFLARICVPDCVILDIQLPGMSGLELEARLRLRGHPMPVVFITAHDERDLLSQVQATHRPFLRKPLDETGLLEAIARVTSAS